MDIPLISQDKVSGKRVFVRADIDVPLRDSGVTASWRFPRMTITNDTRLKDIWPTIEFLLGQGCDVIIAGHIGRPEGQKDLTLSTAPIAHWFSAKVNKRQDFEEPEDIQPYQFPNGLQGFLVSPKLLILENLRFDPREENNDPQYASELASLAQIYVNESFACAEREHASVVGVPKLLPHYAGFRLAKEVCELGKILENPSRPMVVVIGGAKLETKLPVINKMAQVADAVIVGGKLLVETADMEFSPKVYLLKLTEDQKDVVQNTIDSCGSLIEVAKTIVWNGPFGMVEDFTYQVGTKRLAELITANDQAYKVVGGGDTVGFLDKLGLTNKFNWVSSGGGSMLKLLAGEKLPGLEVLLI